MGDEPVNLDCYIIDQVGDEPINPDDINKTEETVKHIIGMGVPT